MSEQRASRHVVVIDTATSSVVVGVTRLRGTGDVEDVAVRIVDDERRHAETLTPLLKECLDDAGWSMDDLDAVVVGCGPGPFTGLRVGMATGAAFGDALGLPVYGICTLDALARAASRTAPAGHPLLVVTDARRREVYWARYVDGTRVDGPGVLAPASLAEVVVDEDLVVAGRTDLVAAAAPQWPTVATSLRGSDWLAVASADILADRDPVPLLPLYLRRPDAVELADQKKKR